MCPDNGNSLSHRLKQIFSPAVRLWIVRELLPERRYAEVLNDFLELSDSLHHTESLQDREQLQALLSQWVRTEQWQYFVPAIEIILQVAHQEHYQAALKTLSKSWPEHLTLSEEGFIQYQNQPLLEHLKPEVKAQEKRQLVPGTTPTEAESRKKIFQRIRQKRLLLLKKWESL